MKILICGVDGQVGNALVNTCPNKNKLYLTNKKDLDITNIGDVRRTLKEIKPDFVINVAAFTSVDNAEVQKNLAHNVNSNGPKNLSIISKETNSFLIHLSTNYVFDGTKKIPYVEKDKTNPLSVYGSTKLLGEQQIIKNLENFLIFRVSGIYGPSKNNFLTKVLEIGKKKDSIKIVSDQYGRPTSSNLLAETIWTSIDRIRDNNKIKGLYHYSESGEIISWHEFAKVIFKYAEKKGYKGPKILPVLSKDYKQLAERPKYSTLDISKSLDELELFSTNWKESLFNTINIIL